jgi:hypothetical protein
VPIVETRHGANVWKDCSRDGCRHLRICHYHFDNLILNLAALLAISGKGAPTVCRVLKHDHANDQKFPICSRVGDGLKGPCFVHILLDQVKSFIDGVQVAHSVGRRHSPVGSVDHAPVSALNEPGLTQECQFRIPMFKMPLLYEESRNAIGRCRRPEKFGTSVLGGWF